ncbi:MAG: hypothetical protein JXR95_07025 [Deltaproteobacteria bacterium]|nr:hypothetical protein [Deltaproteobacteria bacterium]
MKYISFVLIIVPLIIITGCKKQQDQPKSGESSVNTKKTSVSLKLPPPATYCEKYFSCSYETLITDKGKRAMLLKKEKFIQHCENTLRTLPADLVKSYRDCIGKKCGSELRKCISESASRMLKKSEAVADIPKVPAVKPSSDATPLKKDTASPVKSNTTKDSTAVKNKK